MSGYSCVYACTLNTLLHTPGLQVHKNTSHMNVKLPGGSLQLPFHTWSIPRLHVLCNLNLAQLGCFLPPYHLSCWITWGVHVENVQHFTCNMYEAAPFSTQILLQPKDLTLHCLPDISAKVHAERACPKDAPFLRPTEQSVYLSFYDAATVKPGRCLRGVPTVLAYPCWCKVGQYIFWASNWDGKGVKHYHSIFQGISDQHTAINLIRGRWSNSTCCRDVWSRYGALGLLANTVCECERMCWTNTSAQIHLVAEGSVIHISHNLFQLHLCCCNAQIWWTW